MTSGRIPVTLALKSEAREYRGKERTESEWERWSNPETAGSRDTGSFSLDRAVIQKGCAGFILLFKRGGRLWDACLYSACATLPARIVFPIMRPWTQVPWVHWVHPGPQPRIRHFSGSKLLVLESHQVHQPQSLFLCGHRPLLFLAPPPPNRKNWGRAMAGLMLVLALRRPQPVGSRPM